MVPNNPMNFPCGVFYKDFFNDEECEKLKSELVNAEWTPALVMRYEGSEYLGDETDSKISTAVVTKGFKFTSENLNIASLHSDILQIIATRFKLKPDTFSMYGVSKYPVGSSMAIHADTGVYTTKRLITCIIYLSSATEGGDLLFPEVNFKIKVERGMLVCFYSELKHAVSPIIDGERIALIFFAEAA